MYNLNVPPAQFIVKGIPVKLSLLIIIVPAFIVGEPLRANSFSSEVLPHFTAFVQNIYQSEWAEMDKQYGRESGTVFSGAYKRVLKKLDGSTFMIIEIDTPFIHLQRLCGSELNGEPSICSELWVRKSDAYERISKKSAVEIEISQLDMDGYPDAIVRFGCCAAYGIQIFCSVRDSVIKGEWLVMKVYDRYLDGPVSIMRFGRCSDLEISYSPRSSRKQLKLLTRCVDGKLIVDENE